MTKAFTSALGYGVTVRGYIDEDDRLVLLEPEGGGGGGDFKTAALTVKNSSDNSITLNDAILVNEEDGMLEGGMFTIPSGVTRNYIIVLYLNSCMVSIEGGTTYAISGSVALSEGTTNVFIITGDGSIEVS